MPFQSHLEQYKQQGLPYLVQLTEPEIIQLIEYTNDLYYNSPETILITLTDNEYDIMKEYVEQTYPKNTIHSHVGASVPQKNKTTLPYEMWSMNKIKPDTNAIDTWKTKYKGPYIVSSKLDGVSGLYCGDGHLYTRGNGTVGQDISHLLPFLSLPTIPTYMAVRGEFILPKHIFGYKYKSHFANARNLVSGIINSKHTDIDKIADVRFVVYEIVSPEMKPSIQMKTFQRNGFEVVERICLETIDNGYLSNMLLETRNNSPYEIDGLIISNDAVYPRISGNPDHAFAFKMVLTDQMAEAKVVEVIWTPSKNGYLKPRIRIEPIQLCGVTIEYTTGFNAKYIQENKIGMGAVVQIIRSGDVIPYIQSVSVPATGPSYLPENQYSFHWTESHVDIVLEDCKNDKNVCEKNITFFFTKLEVDGLSSGNVARIVKAGYDTIHKIIHLSMEDFVKIEGFKQTMAKKIYDSIREKMKNATLTDLAVASGCFGRGLGKSKITAITEVYPDIFTNYHNPNISHTNISGIGYDNLQEFIHNIPQFVWFLQECGINVFTHGATASPQTSSPETNRIESYQDHPLYKKKIVMTKIRDKNIIDFLPMVGATLENTMTKNVYILLVPSKEESSVKIDYAKKNNIQILTPDEFQQMYMT
jgi:NAD-dependent DNA ligase